MPQISPIEKLPASRSRFTVTIDAVEADKAEKVALARLAASITVDGFRPGKAPPEKVRERVNPDALLEETVRQVLPGVIDGAIKEQKLEPIVPPRVEVQSKSPLQIQVTIVEKPEVKVKAIDKTKLKKTAPKFDDKDIERMVQYLLDQYRTFEPVDRAAAAGDQVTMDFVGTGEDGKELAGTRSTNYAVILGSKSLIPGFEDGLVGVKKGEKKKLNLTFPAKYHAEQLQGKPVTFDVEVKNIEKVHAPTLTPEFVKEKQLGDSPEDVRKRIADSMTEEEVRMDRDRREQAFFSMVTENTKIDIAPELLEQEERMLLENLGRQLEEQKQDFNQWMTRTKRTPESIRKELQEEGRKRITLRYGVQQLVADQKIEVTPEEVKEMAAQVLATVPEEQRKEAEKFYAPGGDGYEELVWRKKVEKLVNSMLE